MARWPVTMPDASGVTYTPADVTDWTGGVDPGDTDDALDQLADRLTAAVAATHTLLDGSEHSDTVAQTPTRGSLIIGNATPRWDELLLGGAATWLRSDGTDPSWQGASQLLTDLLTVDGAGSGLDADLLDGQSGSYYLDSANFTGTNWTDLTDAGATTLHKHDHGGLDGLGDDDHGIYILVTGARAFTGDVTISEASPSLTFDDTTAGHDNWTLSVDSDNLTIDTAASPSDGYLIIDAPIQLQPNYTDRGTTTELSLILFDASFDVAAGTTGSYRMLEFTPSITDAGGLFSLVQCIYGAPTITNTGVALDTFQLFAAEPTLRSATAGVPPLSPTLFYAQPTVRSTDNAVGTVSSIIALQSTPQIQAITNADAAITVTGVYGVYHQPAISTNIAGAAATVTNSYAVYCLNASLSGAGTETLTSQYGMYIANLTSGGSDYGIYVAGADTYAVWVDAGLARFDGNGTRVFELPADATDPTGGGGAATGRIPVLIGGATRYLAYY